MLEEVLMYLNNWFIADTEQGTFTIENGSIELPSLLPNQYFRIIGSVFNDGLHKQGDTDLDDETFTGTIWYLAVPKLIISLVAEIEEWQSKYGATAASPYASESFSGEYSYTKGSGSNGTVTDWKAQFASRLASFRKLRETSYVEPHGHQDPPFVRPYNPGMPWR